MINLSQNQISERYDKIPDKLQIALFDYDNFKKIYDTEKNFNLNEKQLEILEKIYSRIILGFIPLSDLEKEIISGLAISQEDAKKISEILNKEIFASLKEEIEKIGQSRAPQTPIPQANIVNLKKIPAASPFSFSSPSATPLKPNETNNTASLPNKPVINSPALNMPNPAISSTLFSFGQNITKPIQPLSNNSFPAPSSSFSPFPPKPLNIAPSPKPIEQIPPKPVSPAPSFKPQSEPIKKDFIRDFSSPFMIHEESKVEPVFRPDMIENKAVPQMNLVSASSSNSQKQEAVKARVEIGKTRREERVAKSVSPVTAKIEPEKRSAIDYSSFSAPVIDPFSKINSSVSNNPSPVSPSTPVPKPIIKKEEKETTPPPGPSLKGNIVDFRG